MLKIINKRKARYLMYILICIKYFAFYLERRSKLEDIILFIISIFFVAILGYLSYRAINKSNSLAEKISEIINYPVESSIGYPTPGSFGTWAGVERNIPTITLEVDEKIQVQQLVKPVFEIFDYLIMN